MSLYTLHEDQVGRGPSSFTRGLSPDVEIGGIDIFEDFVGGPDGIFTDSGVSSDGDQYGGVSRLTASNTDELCGGLFTSSALSLDKKLAIEVRLKKASVANNASSVFIGVADGALGADVPIIDSGSGDLHYLVNNALGLFLDHEDGDAVSLAYASNSGTQAAPVSVAIAQDTWVKLGFLFEPSKGVTLYKDGVAQATGVDVNAVTGSGFPSSSVVQKVMVAIKPDAATSGDTVDIDWIRVVQEA